MTCLPRAPLRELADSVDYGVTASASPIPSGPKFLRITDIQDNKVNWNSVPWCECSPRELKEAQLRTGDIVFARTGATTGKSFLIKDCPPETVFASYLIRVRVNRDIDPRYVSHFFQSADYWAQITKGARGAAQPGVNATTLKSLEIPIAPLQDQRRIAAILDQAEALRAMRLEALVELNKLPQAIFNEMFGDTRTIFFKWPVINLGELLKFLTSGSRGWAEYYSESGAIFLRIQNVFQGELKLEDVAYVMAPDSAEARRTEVQEGDVLLSITADLGRTAVIPPGLGKAHINQHLSILRTQGVVPQYLSAFLTSPAGQIEILGRNKQGVKAGLNFDDIRSFRIPLPPEELQYEFVKRTQAVAKQKTAQQRALAELDALFASLQHRAFRGEL